MAPSKFEFDVFTHWSPKSGGQPAFDVLLERLIMKLKRNELTVEDVLRAEIAQELSWPIPRSVLAQWAHEIAAEIQASMGTNAAAACGPVRARAAL